MLLTVFLWFFHHHHHHLLLLLLFLREEVAAAAEASDAAAGFTFVGFRGANLSLRGSAAITPDGLLRLTDAAKQQRGCAFFPAPLHFGVGATAVRSFSSTFVFGIVSQYADLSGHGLALVVSPSDDLPGAMGSLYLGLLNKTTDGSPANHLAAVELDTVQNLDLDDINDNHVGIDLNSLRSVASSPAGYFAGSDGDVGGFKNLSLISGEPMQVWVEYNHVTAELNVTMAPMGAAKPSVPLLSSPVNLSAVVLDAMYVGFSSATGAYFTSHYVLGWSFAMGGEAAPAIDLSALPNLPSSRGRTSRDDQKQRKLALWLPLSISSFVLLAVAVAALGVARKVAFSELVEDWEVEYGPNRISYRDLYRATKGFRDGELLGAGGFGRVYRGVLPGSGAEVAVKRVSHDSRQGMREFVAEIVSIGQLRHRNLVPLRGYCRRRGELLLVYDLMPHGSLDRLLYDDRPLLGWKQRLHVARGVAAGLLYLHEDCEQVVIHRDVKPSNVLLDGELNGRLGDFGLARLYDRREGPRTTHVVGTMGYLAPELARTGKATTATDVFSFGVFLLEVACGRRPVEPDAAAPEEVVLADWVLQKWRSGELPEAVDPVLGRVPAGEAEMVLGLGLHCCHPAPAARPSMRQVAQVLEGDAPLPPLSAEHLNASVLQMQLTGGFDQHVLVSSWRSSTATTTESPPQTSESLKSSVPFS